MLEGQSVKFTVTPVRENTDLIDEFEKLAEDTEVSSVVLLNCGASLDIQQQLIDFDVQHHIRCYVIDAHRPLLLANLSEKNERVIVLDDDPIAEARGETPPVQEYDATSDIESEGEDDDEKENEFQPEGVEADEKKRKRSREETRQERQRLKRQRINEYYYASYYAMPAAMSVFKMARAAASPSQDFLWLAAVCLMGYHDNGLLGEQTYNRLAWEELKEALDSTDDFLLSGSVRPSPTLPDADDEADRVRGAKVGLPTRRRLRFESELRLTLYKHWKLEESIMHSAYFYGSLELHRDKGLRALKNFFATAGIPPSEYQAQFRDMEAPIKYHIASKFTDHGKVYGLTQGRMFLQQFVQEVGALGEGGLVSSKISSADVVHVITAMLCAMPTSLGSARPELLPQTTDGRRDIPAISRLEKEAMIKNFWMAYDAVLCDDPAALREGFENAVEMVKVVQNLARQIRDTKAMKATRSFRWCKVEQPPILFRNALAVRRLALWLMQTLYTFTPKGQGVERPLLVMVKDQIKDTYVCVGSTPTKSADQDEFAHYFRTVLRTDKSLKYRYDFFDKSCIEVASEDFERFLELLHNSSE